MSWLHCLPTVPIAQRSNLGRAQARYLHQAAQQRNTTYFVERERWMRRKPWCDAASVGCSCLCCRCTPEAPWWVGASYTSEDTAVPMAQEASQPNALEHADLSLFKQSKGSCVLSETAHSCLLHRPCYIGSRLFFDLLILSHFQWYAHIWAEENRPWIFMFSHIFMLSVYFYLGSFSSHSFSLQKFMFWEKV